MTGRLPAILLGATLASLGACSAATRPEETLDPGSHRASGQLAITASGRESGESIRWEKGAVTHGGKVTSFTVKGLDVGAAGFEQLVVVGEVYDLDRPEDLAGTYRRVLADVRRADDPHGTLLGNEHGVLLMLRSPEEGVAVAPGPDGMVVELAQ